MSLLKMCTCKAVLLDAQSQATLMQCTVHSDTGRRAETLYVLISSLYNSIQQAQPRATCHQRPACGSRPHLPTLATVSRLPAME